MDVSTVNTRKEALRLLNRIVNSEEFKPRRSEINSLADKIVSSINRNEPWESVIPQCEICAEKFGNYLMALLDQRRKAAGKSTDVNDMTSELIANLWETLTSNDFRSFKLFADASKSYEFADFCGFILGSYAKTLINRLSPISKVDNYILSAASKDSVHSAGFKRAVKKYIDNNFPSRDIGSLSDLVHIANHDIVVAILQRLRRGDEAPFDKYNAKKITERELIYTLTVSQSVSPFSVFESDEENSRAFDVEDRRDFPNEFTITQTLSEKLRHCKEDYTNKHITKKNYEQIMVYFICQTVNSTKHDCLKAIVNTGWEGRKTELGHEINSLMELYRDNPNALTLKDAYEFFNVPMDGYNYSLNKIR